MRRRFYPGRIRMGSAGSCTSGWCVCIDYRVGIGILQELFYPRLMPGTTDNIPFAVGLSAVVSPIL